MSLALVSCHAGILGRYGEAERGGDQERFERFLTCGMDFPTATLFRKQRLLELKPGEVVPDRIGVSGQAAFGLPLCQEAQRGLGKYPLGLRVGLVGFLIAGHSPCSLGPTGCSTGSTPLVKIAESISVMDTHNLSAVQAFSPHCLATSSSSQCSAFCVPQKARKAENPCAAHSPECISIAGALGFRFPRSPPPLRSKLAGCM